MSSRPQRRSRGAHWRANLRIVLVCLAVWFLVSFGCGVLWADWLNQWQLFGYPLGFWFAQQGSIYGFLLIIFYYEWRMNRLDREFHVHEDPH